ncbi:MAG: imelysin family protein [Candidatus Thiodiazotropha sp.]
MKHSTTHGADSAQPHRRMNGLLLIGLLLICVDAAGYEFEPLADRYIIPGYRQLVTATEALNLSAQHYCVRQDAAHLASLRENFRNAFLAWQGIQPIRFGPVQYLNRDFRFQLWPDKRDSVTRHLGQLLDDPQLTSAEFDITAKSVAVQGFSALEQLLFSQQPLDEPGCRLMPVIAANLNHMATATLKDWLEGDEPYFKYFIEPGPDNPMFESDRELAGQLLNSLYSQLEIMLTQKLDRPLGEGIDKARGSRAEGWRSDTSLAALDHNLDALQRIITLVLGHKLNADLQRRIRQQFESSRSLRRNIDLPLHRAVDDPSQRVRVLAYRQALSELKRLVTAEMANALDLSLGFNSLDGD